MVEYYHSSVAFSKWSKYSLLLLNEKNCQPLLGGIINALSNIEDLGIFIMVGISTISIILVTTNGELASVTGLSELRTNTSLDTWDNKHTDTLLSPWAFTIWPIDVTSLLWLKIKPSPLDKKILKGYYSMRIWQHHYWLSATSNQVVYAYYVSQSTYNSMALSHPTREQQTHACIF